MRPLNKLQTVLILGSIALLIILWFAPRTGSTDGKEQKKPVTAEAHDHGALKAFIDSVKNSIPPSQKQILQSSAVYSSVPDSILSFWGRVSQPAVAAWYLNELAEKTNTKDIWARTGNTWFLATRMNPGNLRHELYENAISAYEKALEKDPLDLDVKTRLGVCYVEGTGEPMKGITHLREVVATDSTKVDAQMNLGLFAVQSGQYEKAIARFERITKIDPSYAEAWLYIGQTYASMGEKQKAIDALNHFAGMTDDSLVKGEVEKYVRELKNS